MKRLALLILSLFLILPLSATYTLALPDGENGCYQIISDDGDTLDLDDYVWTKRWNGLQVNQYDGDVYTIDDGECTVLASSPYSEWDDITKAMMFSLSTPDLLILYSDDIDAELLADEGVREILFVSAEPSGRAEARMRALGLGTGQARPGEIIVIDDGFHLEREGGIVVRCPRCGEVFTLYL